MEFKAGDIFRFLINSTEYAFGRIMLDVESQCVLPKKITIDSPLNAFPKAILVEIYKQTSENDIPEKRDVLIPGILTSSGFLKIDKWEVVGFKKVNPKNVSFPEGLSSYKTIKGMLVKGELRIPFDMEFEELQEIGINIGSRSCITFGELVLFHLDRKEEIDNPYLTSFELRNLANYDLRFSKFRDKIYKLAGLDVNESYYKLSKRMGFDLNRFYKK